jgi:tetratricopeptide (TPR) repeat protein
MTMRKITIAAIIALACAGMVAHADDTALNSQIAHLQSEWAEINYKVTDHDTKLQRFEQLSTEAEALVDAYPDRAEPMVWSGIVLSTRAGAQGGLGALGLAKKAKARLEAAEKINPDVLNGSIYSSLGTLYAKVPGAPIGFGSKKKARAYLEKAVSVSPDGLDSNYFYGDFLISTGAYEKAREFLDRATLAPSRPGREVADAGRRAEIADDLALVRGHMR